MSIWTKILGEGAGQILKPISDIIDNVTTNKEEKAEAEAKIKQIVYDYEAEMARQFTEREAALLNDVANARAMNIKAMENTDKFVRRFQYYLAAGILLAVFGIIIFIINGGVTPENKDIVHVILGFLTSSAMGVIMFFFGSTRGSESKNEVIKNLSKGSY